MSYNSDLGAAAIMGPQLRNFVEKKLLEDLMHYGQPYQPTWKFDWSQSTVEKDGSMNYMDGKIGGISDIKLFTAEGNLVADGLLDFIYEEGFFVVYWDFVTVYNGDTVLSEKTEIGIPNHIWNQLPDKLKKEYRFARMPE